MLFFAGILAAAVLFPVGVQAVSPTLVRIQDADSSGKAQVRSGGLQVTDANGGSVGVELRPAVLLASGECGLPGNVSDSGSIPAGSTMTSIFTTGRPDTFAQGRLDIYQGAKDVGEYPVISMKVNTDSAGGGDFNGIWSSDAGIRATGSQPWHVDCGYVHTGGGTNGHLWSVFGYPPA
jgi:hypothetical protein